MNQDQEHLRLLEIFHYVVAGLAALFSFLPIFHLVIGIIMVMGGWDGSSEAALVGWLFIGLSSLFIVSGLAFAACLVLAGRFLVRHRRYYFCLVMAATNCAFVPFGTVLGVFTIIVLVRPTVMELFGVSRRAPAAADEDATDRSA